MGYQYLTIIVHIEFSCQILADNFIRLDVLNIITLSHALSVWCIPVSPTFLFLGKFGVGRTGIVDKVKRC